MKTRRNSLCDRVEKCRASVMIYGASGLTIAKIPRKCRADSDS